jgi:para-aminobenzoate synthetase component I
MKPEIFAKHVSQWAANGKAFIFLIDFEMQKPIICPLEEAHQYGLYYNLKGMSNMEALSHPLPPIDMKSKKMSRQLYTERFQNVIHHINQGNSYLLNLTFPTEIELNLSLKEIFYKAKAPYKLLFKDNFVVFSPECFIRIIDDKIYSYPMKGTIDARLENAEALLLSSPKETWEHNTIVDLMRNDLSMIANSISITRFRYIEKIKTHKNELLQTSSEICGELPQGWQKNLGHSLLKILPAGSISGAPKEKTVEIISRSESGPRGYYTGVWGIFDGKNLDSAVLIRYIEQTEEGSYFRSGGGITACSQLDDEYEELIQKVYVPAI